MRKIALFVFFLALFAAAVFAQNDTSYNIPSGSTQVIDKWNIKRSVKNNCPAAIYVPVNTAAEWSNFTTFFPNCVEMVPAVCGDGICDSTENSNDCPDDCDSNIWPYTSDMALCPDGSGKPVPTTGKNCGTWFEYGGCPNWKTYNVTPLEPVILNAFTDACGPCVCYRMVFCLSELVKGVWKQITCFNWGETKEWKSKAMQYTPYENETYSNDSSQNKIKITGEPNKCFYFYLNRVLKTS